MSPADASFAKPRLRDVLWLAPRLGLRACAFQAGYRIQRKLGWQKRRFPLLEWEDAGLQRYLGKAVTAEAYVAARKQDQPRFFFAPGRPAEAGAFLATQVPEAARDALLEECQAIADGSFRFFSDRLASLGTPPDWSLNPFTHAHADVTLHWCDLPDFAASQGDVKILWEASRFGWTYALVRAYALTGEDRYANGFWTLLEHWLQVNRPNRGPQWKCGQECAFRLMALCFAFYAFQDAPASTPERLARLAGAIAFHAERIEGNIAYALSLRNNHGIGEALGLFTAGLLFPEFAPAARWLAKGRKLLVYEARRQIFADGSFIQHSLTYQRVMLHDYAWVLRLAALNGVQFDAEVHRRVADSARLLAALIEPTSGDVPNYGSNDGALVLPLASGGYRDFRPVVQAAHFAATGKRLLARGSWDEEMVWLAGSGSLDAPCEAGRAASHQARSGGYFTLRGETSWAMLRCHSYETRPCQADMLHLDLWWRGCNVLQDSGTYAYYAPPPWDKAFSSTAAHNTIMVDRHDQMKRIGRFLWRDWTRSRFVRQEKLAGGTVEVWEGEHFGYQPVVHRRVVVRCDEDAWVVIDDVTGGGAGTLQLHWHFLDAPCQLDGGRVTLATPMGEVGVEVLSDRTARFSLARGEESGAGWRSLYYGRMAPAPSLAVTVEGPLPARFITCIGLGGLLRAEWQGERVVVSRGERQWVIDLQPAAGAGSRVRQIELRDPAGAAVPAGNG